MENTKPVKIFVANINMIFFENTSQKGMRNRKRNKINLTVATTFDVRNKNGHNLCGNIDAFSWREDKQGQTRKIFKVSLNKLRKKPTDLSQRKTCQVRPVPFPRDELLLGVPFV